jgi:uncharacterized protein
MKPFSLLIKPSSADCNLRCRYCFYRGKRGLYPEREKPRMSQTTLKRMIKSFMSLNMPIYNFGWQGGEPLLMGIDFYREVVKLQKRYGRPGASVANGFQTNGVLIDDAWCKLFREYNFLVGLSMDGPEEIHDQFRLDRKNRGTFSRVEKVMNLMKESGVEFNVLSVIHRENTGRAPEIYNFLREKGIKFQQYIPAIIALNKLDQAVGFAFSGEEYGRFLLDLFNRWYPDDVRTVSIRHFDAIINALVTGQANLCNMGEDCDSYFLIEYNGDVYPCDYFVEEEWRLGNINTHSWEELYNHEKRKTFAEMKRHTNPACSKCAYVHLCYGDCTRHRSFKGAEPEHLSILCKGIKMFLKETLPEFEKLAEQAREMLNSRENHGSISDRA